ncbi:MAG: DUF1566 domain-containing protein [Magnetococcales bacterium]|nr:DUF1566 domain-containing protein [Magnetococcales bacterium]
MKKQHKIMIGIVAGMVCLVMAWITPDASERFVNNGNGTITDHKAKLIALIEEKCFQKRNWDESMTDVSRISSGMCGLSDGSRPGSWRLPSKRELPILVDWRKSGLFPGVRTGFYWSSTANEEDTSLAWVGFLTTGYIGNDVKTDKNEIWAVRDMP